MNKKIIEIFLILLLSLTPILWFSGDKLLLGHDSGFRLSPLEYVINLYYSWNPMFGFGSDHSLNKGFMVTLLPESAATFLTGSLRDGEIFTFVFWFFVIGMSMWVFSNAFFPGNKFWFLRIYSSIFYMFNFFLLQGWFIAERAKFSLFAALPLALLILYKTFTKEYSLIKGSILIALLFFLLNGGGSPPLYGAIILTLSLCTLYFLGISLRLKKYSSAFYILKTVFAFAILAIVVNAYWVIPQLYLAFSSYSSALGSQGGVDGILGWESVVSKYVSILNLLRLQGIPDWYENVHHAFSEDYINSPVLIIASILPISTVILGFLYFPRFAAKLKNTKLILFLAILLIVSALFTAGSHPPFGNFYVLLVKYIPGFAIFRSAFYKFGPAFWFSMIFLSGYFINLFLLTFIKGKKTVYLAGSIIILGIVFYHYPYFKGSFFTWSPPFTTMVKAPDYVLEISEHARKNAQDSRILLLPMLDPTPPNADSYTWGYWSLDTLPLVFFKSSIISNSGEGKAAVDDLYDFLKEKERPNFEYLAQILGIDTVLWREDVIFGDKVSTSENTGYLTDSFFENNPKLLKKSGDWSLYESTSSAVQDMVSVPSSLFYSEAPFSLGKSLESLGKPLNPGVFELGNDQSNSVLKKYADKEIVSATCILCLQNKFWDLQRQDYVPVVRILPGSIFYPYILWKEERLNAESRNDPEKKIDFNLSVATKRIQEIYWLNLREDNEKSSEEIGRNVERYKTALTEAMNSVKNLPDETRNDYLLRILEFIQLQHNYLVKIPYKAEIPGQYNRLSNFQASSYRKLYEEARFTKGKAESNYLIQVVTSGDYLINVEDQDKYGYQIFVNGNLVQDGAIYLGEGVHELDLVSDDTDINGQNRINNFSYSVGEDREFEISGIEKGAEYLLEFNYASTGSIEPLFSIVQYDSTGEEIQLEFSPEFRLDALNNRFYYFIKPHILTEKMVFKFSADGDNKGYVDVEDFSYSKYKNPYVMLQRDNNGERLSQPKIEFQKIDPTKYLVKISDAKDPFILNLNQTYHPGWTIGVESLGHFKLNSFSNAWLIDKEGSYEFELSYAPQKYVLIGGAISIVAVIAIIILLFKKRND